MDLEWGVQDGNAWWDMRPNLSMGGLLALLKGLALGSWLGEKLVTGETQHCSGPSHLQVVRLSTLTPASPAQGQRCLDCRPFNCGPSGSLGSKSQNEEEQLNNHKWALELKSSFYYLLSRWSWANYLISLSWGSSSITGIQCLAHCLSPQSKPSVKL